MRDSIPRFLAAWNNGSKILTCTVLSRGVLYYVTSDRDTQVKITTLHQDWYWASSLLLYF